MLNSKSKIGQIVLTLAVSGLIACGCGSSSSLPTPGPDGGSGTGGASGTGGSSGTGGASGSTTSGVTGTKRIDALTLAEKKQVCDFQAAHFGGYGKSIDCGGGTSLIADDTQADCLAEWPATCAATVTQTEKCSNDMTCANFPFPASCAPLFTCQ